MDKDKNEFTGEENIRCPDEAPEEQKGVTEEERRWSVKSPPPPRVPRCVFAALALILAAAFAGGGWWYYRANVLPEKYYLRASALFKAEEYARAEELYQKIMEIKPERRDLFYHIGFCREKMGDLPGAMEYYERHLKSADGDVKAMARLGWLYMERGDFERALKWLKEAGKHNNDEPDIWRMTAEAAEKAGDGGEAAAALSRLAELEKEPEKIMECGRRLIRLGAYRRALTAYALAAEAAPEDKAPIHGMNAARAMLGLPTDRRYLITPGTALGAVRLGAEKAEAKESLGGGSPDSKEFALVGGKSMLAGHPVEIWTYHKGDPEREIRIIFIGGRVSEIETASPLYKTEEGLGLSNFLLAKNAGKLKWRREARGGALLCLAKGGGLTFYALGLTDDGSDAAEKRLRVHHGDVSIDNVDDLPLMRFQSSR
ncbi:MAG: tetratricopeptide repeat protein [Synergistaceae bacterium]|nr:tetratricopeptide repeat protein [Synergistaceae bacterium]